MTLIKTIPPSQANGRLKEIYTEIKGNFLTVPYIFQALSLRVDILEAVWEAFKALMLHGDLPRESKEMLAVTASQANGCKYCIGIHSMFLRVLGFSDKEIGALHASLASAELKEETRVLLRFARKVASGANDLMRRDIEELQCLGYSDRQIIEAGAVLASFAFVNRLVDALAVESELPVRLVKNKVLAAFMLPVMRRKLPIS